MCHHRHYPGAHRASMAAEFAPEAFQTSFAASSRLEGLHLEGPTPASNDLHRDDDGHSRLSRRPAPQAEMARTHFGLAWAVTIFVMTVRPVCVCMPLALGRARACLLLPSAFCLIKQSSVTRCKHGVRANRAASFEHDLRLATRKCYNCRPLHCLSARSGPQRVGWSEQSTLRSSLAQASTVAPTQARFETQLLTYLCIAWTIT